MTYCEHCSMLSFEQTSLQNAQGAGDTNKLVAACSPRDFLAVLFSQHYWQDTKIVPLQGQL